MKKIPAILFAVIFSGCFAQPFPCSDGEDVVGDAACAIGMTEHEIAYTDIVVREFGGEEYFWGTKIQFHDHAGVTAAYEDTFRQPTPGNIAGFNNLHHGEIHCVDLSLAHELQHQVIWIDSGGKQDGHTHTPASGWTYPMTEFVRAVKHQYAPLLRGEPPRYIDGFE